MAAGDAARAAELHRTSRHLCGHGVRHPADELERVAAWVRAEGATSDAYGKGVFLQAFEAKIAALLGYPAARFMPSGTMAQQIALRVWSEASGCKAIGLHPTSHLELHEQKGYARLHGLKATLIGPADRPLLAEDLAKVKGRLAALLVELPTRENGGQLPSWSQLEALKAAARERDVRLHLDGARLWEAQTFYERPFAEICAGFDSAYVSFYKGIGALPGAMLLGPQTFLDDAIVWQRRQGGNLHSSLVNAASAAMRLEERLAAMPRYREKALELGPRIGALDGVEVVPNPPQTTMFHAHFAFPPEAVSAARTQVADELGVWLVGGVRPGKAPYTAVSELSLGDACLGLEPDAVLEAFARLLELARAD